MNKINIMKEIQQKSPSRDRMFLPGQERLGCGLIRYGSMEKGESGTPEMAEER